MSIIKKWFYTFLLWLHRQKIGGAQLLIEFFFNSDIPGNGGDNFRKLVKYRQIEIPFNNPPRKYQVTGDSIIHLGEKFFEDEGIVCSAIGGDRTDTLLDRLEKNVLPYFSTIIMIDIGGNDLLWGDEPDIVFKRIQRISDRLKQAGARRVGFYDILPLGNPDDTTEPLIKEHADLLRHVNFTQAPVLNRLMQQSPKIEVIPVRSLLEGADGWIKPEYSMSDKIHVLPKAYSDVYIPQTKLYIQRSSL